VTINKSKKSRNKKTKKIKKKLKYPERSTAIKASFLLQAYWMLYQDTNCKNVSSAMKRYMVNGNIAKKMRHRAKFEKQKVM
jgi:hypothetical protein